MPATAGRDRSLGGILDALRDLARQSDAVTVGDLVNAFGARSHGPFLLLPALLELSPIGAVPGVPTLLAAVVLLFGGQMLLGRERLWVPRFVERWRMPSTRVLRSERWLRPLGRRLDRWFHGRLQTFTRGPFVRVAAASCMVLACTVPLLEVVPFASSIPMGAIALFGLALLVRDGALMLAASALAVGTGMAIAMMR